MGNGPVAADELRLLIERVERIDEEIANLKLDRKDVLREMKTRGFCTKTAQWAITERKKTPDRRREEEAMRQIYRGALGMLDGTPLGDYALQKLSAKKPPKPKDEGTDGKTADTEAPKAAPEKFMPEVDLARAAQMGREAAQNGQDVLTNPFPGGDPRRAAWDEAWCQELGSDGMDIPEALRPAKKGKGKPKGEDAANDGQQDSGAEDANGDCAEDDASGASDQPAEDEPADEAAEDESQAAADDSDLDEAYPSVRAFVLQEQRASVTLFRKAFGIGYRKAAHLIERLELDGVISAPDVSGLREVLLDKEGKKK